MTTPRYRIFDLAMRRYVRRVEVIDEDPPVSIVTYTSDPAQAQRFPGVKSARRLARRHEIDHIITNAKGDQIP